MVDVGVTGNFWSILAMLCFGRAFNFVWPLASETMPNQPPVRLEIVSRVFKRGEKRGKLPQLAAALSRLEHC
ncbi:hypothetical protein DPMN_121264 [Dreissena polymorpha]|uniref:Uncharacterized protein n=1 Tax=Dreissena polymorpha TaxID=45954 RepID=A0A9D4GLC8_DREPO|nr:hypothetical protein DPMN_121264 [Dreissena polymorpha]